MIRNYEQWVYLLRSWLTEQLWHTYVPHQALITSSSRKFSREVGMPRSTREKMSIPGNVFDRQHAQRDPDELYKYSKNWQHHQESLMISRILRKEGIEKNGSEEPLQSRPLPCFSVRLRRKSLDSKQVLCLWLTMSWVFGLVLKWHDNSEISLLGDASVIPGPNGISEMDREFPSRSLRKSSQQKKRAKNSYTERKNEESFQRKTIGSCSRRDACCSLHRHATGDREDNVECSAKTLEILTWSKHTLHCRKWRHITDGKSMNSLKASPATKVKKNPCLWWARWKTSSCDYRQHPVCRGYKSGNRCIHGYCCLCGQADGKSNFSAKSGKKVLKDKLLFWEKKKESKVVCLKIHIQWILRKVEELGLNASAGDTRNS